MSLTDDLLCAVMHCLAAHDLARLEATCSRFRGPLPPFSPLSRPRPAYPFPCLPAAFHLRSLSPGRGP